MKMTYEEIEERIRETESFAIYSLTKNEINGINRISEGIRLALMEESDTIKNTELLKEFEECSNKFNSCDFGTFYERDEHPSKGKEWGEYNTSIGLVWIHREEENVVLFFPFER